MSDEPQLPPTSWQNLAGAFCWRLGREGKRYLLTPVITFVVLLTFLVLLATVGSGQAINGSAEFTSVATQYARGPHALTIGLILTLGPAMVALFSAMATSRMVQGIVGAEVHRGGYEELLSAPYRPGQIATALLGYTLTVATGLCVLFTLMETLAVALVAGTLGIRLDLSGDYLACVLLLPFLVAYASGGLALLTSLLFPRLTQLGSAAALTGGSIGNLVAMLPGLGAVFALTYGLPGLGPLPLLAAAGGATALLTAVSMTTAVAGFRPETVLDS